MQSQYEVKSNYRAYQMCNKQSAESGQDSQYNRQNQNGQVSQSQADIQNDIFNQYIQGKQTQNDHLKLSATYTPETPNLEYSTNHKIGQSLCFMNGLIKLGDNNLRDNNQISNQDLFDKIFQKSMKNKAEGENSSPFQQNIDESNQIYSEQQESEPEIFKNLDSIQKVSKDNQKSPSMQIYGIQIEKEKTLIEQFDIVSLEKTDQIGTQNYDCIETGKTKNLEIKQTIIKRLDEQKVGPDQTIIHKDNELITNNFVSGSSLIENFQDNCRSKHISTHQLIDGRKTFLTNIKQTELEQNYRNHQPYSQIQQKPQPKQYQSDKKGSQRCYQQQFEQSEDFSICYTKNQDIAYNTQSSNVIKQLQIKYSNRSRIFQLNKDGQKKYKSNQNNSSKGCLKKNYIGNSYHKNSQDSSEIFSQMPNKIKQIQQKPKQQLQGQQKSDLSSDDFMSNKKNLNIYYSQKKYSTPKSLLNSNHSLEKITQLQLQLIHKINNLQLIIKDLSLIQLNLSKGKPSSVKPVSKSPLLKSSIHCHTKNKFTNRRLQDNYQVRLENRLSSLHGFPNYAAEYTRKKSITRQINGITKSYQGGQIQKRPNYFISFNDNLKKDSNDRTRLRNSQRSHDQRKAKYKVQQSCKNQLKKVSSKEGTCKSQSNALLHKQKPNNNSLLKQIKLLKQKVQALQQQKRRRSKLKQQINPLRQKQVISKQKLIILNQLTQSFSYEPNQKLNSPLKVNSSLKKNSLSANKKQSAIQTKREAQIKQKIYQNQVHPNNQDYFPKSPSSRNQKILPKKSPIVSQFKLLQKSQQFDPTKNRTHKNLLISYQIIDKKGQNDQYQFENGFNFGLLSQPLTKYPPHLQDNQQNLTEKALRIYKKLQKIMKVDFSKINQLYIQKQDNCVTFEISSCYQGYFNIIWSYPSNLLLNKNSSLLFCGQWTQTCDNLKKTKSKDGQGIQILDTQYFYKGSFRNNFKNGSGVIYYSNGDMYFGEWRDNFMNGNGVYLTFQGDFYKGSFINNKKNGYGNEKFRNGDSYKGFYHQGLFHGQGKYKWSNGSTYKGDFRQGHLHGKGVWKSGEGDIYQGDYFMDQKHGFGKYIWKNGAVYKGMFQNGKKSSN